MTLNKQTRWTENNYVWLISEHVFCIKYNMLANNAYDSIWTLRVYHEITKFIKYIYQWPGWIKMYLSCHLACHVSVITIIFIQQTKSK